VPVVKKLYVLEKFVRSLQLDRPPYETNKLFKIYKPLKVIFLPYSYGLKADMMSLKFMTPLSIQIRFEMLTQAAQIYARQFFSLLSAARFMNVRPGDM